MRLISKCQHCQTQYDATGHTVGSRFHCLCGHVVVVLSPKDEYNLKVLRCSNCSAATGSDHDGCKFCGAVFSLTDRNLNTMCGNCTERVADHAKFCHRCGDQIRPLEVIGETTNLACSNCKDKTLTKRPLGRGIFVFECESCTGLWLDHPSFQSVEKHSMEDIRIHPTPSLSLDIGPSNAKASVRPSTATKKDHHRRCPKCNELMLQRNYQRTSGILVDVCGPHGIWFDADELGRIIQWLESGGYQKTQGKRDVLTKDILASTSAKTTEHRFNIHNQTERVDVLVEGVLATLIRITFGV